MARGLVGVNEIRASSQLNRYPPTSLPRNNYQKILKANAITNKMMIDLEYVLPKTAVNRNKNKSVLQIDSKKLSPRNKNTQTPATTGTSGNGANNFLMVSQQVSFC